jgi:hypothetical protein
MCFFLFRPMDGDFAGRFQVNKVRASPERNTRVLPFWGIIAVFSKARIIAFSIVFWLGSHSMRVRAISSIMTRLFRRSLMVAEKLLQPVDPNNLCLPPVVRVCAPCATRRQHHLAGSTCLSPTYYLRSLHRSLRRPAAGRSGRLEEPRKFGHCNPRIPLTAYTHPRRYDRE